MSSGFQRRFLGRLGPFRFRKISLFNSLPWQIPMGKTAGGKVICMKKHKNVLSIHDINHHIKIHSYLENHSFSLCHYELHRSNKTGWMSTLAIRSLEYLPRSLGLEASHEASHLPIWFPKTQKKQQQSTLQILTPISKVLLVVQGYKLIPPSIVCLILNKNGDSSVYIYICIYITPPPFPVDDWLHPPLKKSPPKKNGWRNRWVVRTSNSPPLMALQDPIPRGIKVCGSFTTADTPHHTGCLIGILINEI